MAHAHGNSKNDRANASANINGGSENEVKPTTFHDFLGNKGQGHESVPAAVGGGRKPPVVSPSATSGSERHVSNHLEGIPFYGSRGDITGPESSKRFTGYKRSNSDSFMVSSRDKFPRGQSDPQDGMMLTKLLRYSGAERSRRPTDEEPSFNMQQTRPISASLLSHSPAANRADANTSKRDRAIPINMSPTLQYPPRSAQVMQFGNQTPSNRFKETNVVSQTAADEGSRTRIKGSGSLNSMNAGPTSGRQSSGVLIRTGKQKSGAFLPELESSTPPSQRGTDSTGRQMTIFYGGQAHVFDNVHPNKADVIMTLAGSNGGSWFTNYASSNSAAARPSTGDNHHHLPVDENDPGITMLREFHVRPSDKGDALRGFGSGSYEGVIRSKDKMDSAQAAKVGAEDDC